MAQEKLSLEDFLEAVDPNNKPFIQELHKYFLDNGCKGTFEEKKSGPLASYKHTKLKRSIANVIFRKHGMLVRIYGENANKFQDFMNTLPQEMVQAIDNSGECKRLTQNLCSPKCTGYDFTIGDTHFQKCRYNCFEFLVNEESKPYITTFIENELRERTTVAVAH